MKPLVIISMLFLAFCQPSKPEFSAPRLQKMPIGNSGCSAYLPDTKPAPLFDISYSEDSATLYSGEVISGDFHFAVITVSLKDILLGSRAEKEDMCLRYLHFLKQNFSIQHSSGYTQGLTSKGDTATYGVMDHWVDKEKNQWTVKAWCQQKTLAVMMLYGPREYPNETTQNKFLNSIEFPAQ